jgi:TRAP-type mannitol/chloroaromatic compound transport system substrate-binding protein
MVRCRHKPLGWYKKPVTKPDDFKGMKFRNSSISIDLFQGMGACGERACRAAKLSRRWTAVCSDAAEFNNASSDRALASPTSPRFACCKAIIRTPSQLEDLSSTRQNSTRAGKDAGDHRVRCGRGSA